MRKLPELYSVLHQMLRESGFGGNVFPLIGCNGVLAVKVAFSGAPHPPPPPPSSAYRRRRHLLVLPSATLTEHGFGGGGGD